MLKALAKFAYRLFGRYVYHHREKYLPIQEELKRARLPYSLDEYISLSILLSIIAFFVFFLCSLALSWSFPLTIRLLLSFVSGIGGALFTFFYMLNYPSIAAINRASSIDEVLPYAVMHMSTLAGTSIPPHEIFRIMGKIKEYGEVARECSIIYRDIVVLGKDIFTVLSEAAKNSPSRAWAEVLWGISSTLRTGGSLRNYLYMKSRELRTLLERKEREAVEATNLLTEVYLIIFVLGPLLAAIMLLLASMFTGGTILGVPPLTLFGLLVYVIVPVLGLIFLLFADRVRPREM